MRVVITVKELEANYELYKALARELPKEFTEKGHTLGFESYAKESGFVKNPEGMYSLDIPEEIFVEMNALCKTHVRVLVKAGRAVYAALELFREVYKDFLGDIAEVADKINKLTRGAE